MPEEIITDTMLYFYRGHVWREVPPRKNGDVLFECVGKLNLRAKHTYKPGTRELLEMEAFRDPTYVQNLEIAAGDQFWIERARGPLERLKIWRQGSLITVTALFVTSSGSLAAEYYMNEWSERLANTNVWLLLPYLITGSLKFRKNTLDKSTWTVF